MKQLKLIVSLFLCCIAYFSYGQSPVIISQPYKFQKYVRVTGSLFSDSTLLDLDSSKRVPTTAWVKKNFVSTIGAGTVLSFNTRTGAVVPVAGDYASLTETLTGKTMSGSSNTFTNIGNSSLVNSLITANGVSMSLGGSYSLNLNNSLTVNNGGAGDASGFTFNGSVAKSLSYNSIGAVPTTRTINGLDLSTNRTITANTPNALANGWGMLSFSYNGGTPGILVAPDTTAGHLATQYYASIVVGPDGIVLGLTTTVASPPTAVTTAGTYRLNNALVVKGSSTNTTIDAQDATLNRYDLIVADASGTFSVV